MFIGHWEKDLIRLMCFLAVLAGVAGGSGRRPPPTPEITLKGNFLNFNASAPNSTPPYCWEYVFHYRKCNEEPVTVIVSKNESWTAKVEYDVACNKYTVRVQAKYETKCCGEGELDSDMSEPVYFGRRPPPPTPEITLKGNFLNFYANFSLPLPQCWEYVFQYKKCNEEPVTVIVSEKESWTAKVEYDVACKYTVQVQATYKTKYCGEYELDSDMSEPVYFGEDNDPNLPFKVTMIAIPVMVCACLVFAIVLFRRNKDTFFPKVPSPAHFFTTMVDSNTEMKKDLYERELYVPNEEVVDQIHVALETTPTSWNLISNTT